MRSIFLIEVSTLSRFIVERSLKLECSYGVVDVFFRTLRDPIGQGTPYLALEFSAEPPICIGTPPFLTGLLNLEPDLFSYL